MTNIFNKKVLVENGTLINNWYEEEALKKITGETRTIPGFHLKKKRVDGELEISCESFNKKDQTKVRTMGVDNVQPYSTTNKFYGDFSSSEHKFDKIGIKEKIFKDFFTSYLTNEKAEKLNHEKRISDSRLNDTTNKDIHIQQPLIQKIGSRHMQTQDGLPIDQSTLDKYFMASHDMSKYQTVISNDKLKDYFRQFVPYYKDKEVTFWSQNIGKSIVHKSHSKGINPFARSCGMTQIVNNSKSVNQFYGNINSNDENDKVNCINYQISPEEMKFSEEFLEQSRIRVEDLTHSIRQKFFEKFYSIGWIGIRKYKQYLINLSKRKSSLIEKSDFKYFTTNFGIYLNDKENDFIFNIFDDSRQNKICFLRFINEFLKVS